MDLRTAVERARHGDAGAFNRALKLTRPRALAYARRILSDDQAAEDAVQEACVAAFQRIAQLEDAAAFEQWLHRAVYRNCLRLIAGKRRSQASEITERNAADDFEASLLEHLALAPIGIAIDRLRDDHRRIISLYYKEGFSLSEIGAHLNLSVEAVKMRLYDARTLLRRRLAFAGDAPDACARRPAEGLAVVTTYVLNLAAARPAASQPATTYAYGPTQELTALEALAMANQQLSLRSVDADPTKATMMA